MNLEKPLKPLHNEDGSVNVENVTRYYRFIQWNRSRIYYLTKFEHWPEDKLPKEESYPKEFLRIFAENEGDVVNRLRIDRQKAADLCRCARSYRDREPEDLTAKERNNIGYLVHQALKDNPMAAKIKDEFREDARTREEKLIDYFNEHNKKRMKEPLGSKTPFHTRFIAEACTPEFLDYIGVEADKRSKLVGYGEAAKKGLSASQAGNMSNEIARSFYNLPSVKNRISASSKPRRFVHGESSMYSIYSELVQERGEVYNDRKPEKGEARGRKGTGYSEDLLRTIFDARLLGKVGLVISPSETDLGFLADTYVLEHPIRSKDGLTYPSVENAFLAAAFTDPETRKRIAEADPRTAWKVAKDLPKDPEWDEKKWDVKEKLLYAKFKLNPDLAKKLIATDTEKLRQDKHNGIRLAHVKETLLKEQGDRSSETWLKEWKAQIDSHPEPGDLDKMWEGFNEKQKDSLHMCISTVIIPAFKKYKELHPEEFPAENRNARTSDRMSVRTS